MSVNFNAITPAAPANNTNITWQVDTSGNASGYVPTSAQEFTGTDLTAQSADISATTLLSVSSAGVYRITAYTIVTQAATTSSTLPSITITWTDADNNTAQSLTLTSTNTGNALTSYQQATCVVDAIASSNIQFSTTGYASVGATPMQYAVHIRIEKL